MTIRLGLIQIPEVLCAAALIFSIAIHAAEDKPGDDSGKKPDKELKVDGVEPESALPDKEKESGQADEDQGKEYPDKKNSGEEKDTGMKDPGMRDPGLRDSGRRDPQGGNVSKDPVTTIYGTKELRTGKRVKKKPDSEGK